jgi:hypothetical protein
MKKKIPEYIRKIHLRSEEIKNDSFIQEKIQELKQKLPKFKKEKEYLKYINKISKEERTKGEKEIIYFKKYQDFCNHYGIDYINFRMGKIRAKSPVMVQTRYDKEGNPDLVICLNKDKKIAQLATARDIHSIIPLFISFKDYYFGKFSAKKGAKNKISKYRRARAEYKRRRKKGESCKNLIAILTNNYKFPSRDRTRRIVNSRKYD